MASASSSPACGRRRGCQPGPARAIVSEKRAVGSKQGSVDVGGLSAREPESGRAPAPIVTAQPRANEAGQLAATNSRAERIPALA